MEWLRTSRQYLWIISLSMASRSPMDRADGELGGELVNVVGVHMALLDGLAAEGVEDNQHVFPVDQGVFRPGGDPVGFEQAVIPGRLHVVPAGDGLQHLVLHLVALLDGVDGDGGGVV